MLAKYKQQTLTNTLTETPVTLRQHYKLSYYY